jgi:hypothetical protein
MRLRLLLLVAGVGCVAALLPMAGAGANEAGRPVRATLVGDSVAASLVVTSNARAHLRRGLSVRLDVAVCRRLVATSCPYQGARPASALEAIRAAGRSLGSVLVVDVGYNESGEGYGEGIDRIMRAARAQGVSGVVWVTLREADPVYRKANTAIRDASRRWPGLVVADWNAHSAGRPWFAPDGIHLSARGAVALAAFLRPLVFAASG